MDDSMQKMLMALATTTAGGIMTWLAMSARRSFRNVGRTEVEIAVDELKAALEAERLAKATADPADDKAAHAAVVLAQARVTKAKRLRALLDAGAGDVE